MPYCKIVIKLFTSRLIDNGYSIIPIDIGYVRPSPEDLKIASLTLLLGTLHAIEVQQTNVVYLLDLWVRHLLNFCILHKKNY